MWVVFTSGSTIGTALDCSRTVYCLNATLDWLLANHTLTDIQEEYSRVSVLDHRKVQRLCMLLFACPNINVPLRYCMYCCTLPALEMVGMTFCCTQYCLLPRLRTKVFLIFSLKPTFWREQPMYWLSSAITPLAVSKNAQHENCVLFMFLDWKVGRITMIACNVV